MERKFKICFAILILSLSLNLSTAENDFLLTKVLHDIADKFLLNEKNDFSIITYKVGSDLLNSVSTKFMAGLKEKHSYFLRKERKHRAALIGSAYFFMDYLDFFYEIELCYRPIRLHKQPIKYFAFIPSLTFKELKLLKIPEYNNNIPRLASFVFQYTYFITDEEDSIILSTVEWFGSHGCDFPHVYMINSFNKTTMKWNKKLQNHEKFLQYHGCELSMLLPTEQENGAIHHVSGYSVVSDDLTKFEIHGITPAIFEIAAKYQNFKVAYQPASMPPSWLTKTRDDDVKLIKINNSTKDPHVYFELATLQTVNIQLSSTKVVANLNVNIFVTPAEKFSPYEKFLLPFDSPTWIFSFLTFLATFLSILIINNLPKSTQTIVYGQKVDTPIWNVISIFFGISQTKLPNKNFSRFILLIFIYFCLIFRTCFQSKFFEFMTSEPRQLPPKTIDEIIERKYSVYTMHGTEYIASSKHRETRWPIVYSKSPLSYQSVYFSQSQNSSAKMALVVDEYFTMFATTKNKIRAPNWNQLDNTVVYTYHDTFVFIGTSFYFRMFDKIIDSFIPTGIMQHLIKNYYVGKLIYEEIEKAPKELALEDLAFGFNIWLAACAFSVIALFAEFVVNSIRRRMTPFAQIHPTNPKYHNDQNAKYEISNPQLQKIFRVKKLVQVETTRLIENMNIIGVEIK